MSSPDTAKKSDTFGEFLLEVKDKLLICVMLKPARLFGVKRLQSSLNVGFDLSINVTAGILFKQFFLTLSYQRRV